MSEIPLVPDNSTDLLTEYDNEGDNDQPNLPHNKVLDDLSKYSELDNEGYSFGSYNLSFVIEKGEITNFASDDTLYQRQKESYPEESTTDPRIFFKNEMTQIKKFISYASFAAIGFQEVSIYKTDERGTYTNIISEIEDTSESEDSLPYGSITVGGKNISYAYGDIKLWREDKSKKFSASQGALMLWDTNKLGEFRDQKVLDFTMQPGRPIQMVKTQKDFLLINFHAPNIQAGQNYKAEYLTQIFGELLPYIADFNSDKSIPPRKIVFMSDLNDHRNFMRGIGDTKKNRVLKEELDETPYIMNGISFSGDTYTYQGDAPLSCCYSYTSSCTDTQFGTDTGTILPTFAGLKSQTPTTDRKECRRVAETGPDGTPKKDRDQAKTGALIPLSGKRGYISNYRHQSDFVFAHEDVCGSIKTFNIFESDQSVQSDHEMVYMLLREDPASTLSETKGRLAKAKMNPATSLSELERIRDSLKKDLELNPTKSSEIESIRTELEEYAKTRRDKIMSKKGGKRTRKKKHTRKRRSRPAKYKSRRFNK